MLMERALTDSISPSIFTSLFVPHPGEPEETGEKALKMKRGANPAGFSMKGLQNSWKLSSPGLPCAPMQVSDSGGIGGRAAGGFGVHCTPGPYKRNIRVSPEPSCARSWHGPDPPLLPPLPLPWRCRWHRGTVRSVRHVWSGQWPDLCSHTPGVAGGPRDRAGGAGQAPAGPHGSPKPRGRDEGIVPVRAG